MLTCYTYWQETKIQGNIYSCNIIYVFISRWLAMTKSGKQTSHTASSCPTHLLALNGFGISQQHTTEPVSNATAHFSCIPCQNFNEDLQARGCIVGEGAGGLTWFTRKPSAFQGLHKTAGSISTFFFSPSQKKPRALLLFFLFFPTSSSFSPCRAGSHPLQLD